MFSGFKEMEVWRFWYGIRASIVAKDDKKNSSFKIYTNQIMNVSSQFKVYLFFLRSLVKLYRPKIGLQ